MSDLRPMVVMVCGPCRRGDYTTEPVPGCVICGVLLLERADEPLRSARSREEMVEAGSRAIQVDAAHGLVPGFMHDGTSRSLARACLNAAIPGLLED